MQLTKSWFKYSLMTFEIVVVNWISVSLSNASVIRPIWRRMLCLIPYLKIVNILITTILSFWCTLSISKIRVHIGIETNGNSSISFCRRLAIFPHPKTCIILFFRCVPIQCNTVSITSFFNLDKALKKKSWFSWSLIFQIYEHSTWRFFIDIHILHCLKCFQIKTLFLCVRIDICFVLDSVWIQLFFKQSRVAISSAFWKGFIQIGQFTQFLECTWTQEWLKQAPE